MLNPIMYKGLVPGDSGGAMAPPDFGRSVNPISTREDRLCPPNYYWHPRIFRPSDGPVSIVFFRLELTSALYFRLQTKIQQTKMLFTCQRFAGLAVFYKSELI